MIDQILSPVLNLHGPVAYVLVAVLAFGEAAILLGFVIPGETAVILGGVICSLGHADIALMVPVAVVAAIVGDSVGYEVGRVLGTRLLGLRPLRRHQRAIGTALDFLRKRGAWAVFVGRFTAFLRAMVPGLAGMAGMAYPRFLLANAAGGIVWATGFTLLGYFLGHVYKQVEKVSGWASAGLLAAVVLLLIGLRVRTVIRDRRLEGAASEEAASEDA